MSRHFLFMLLFFSAVASAGDVNKCRKADGSLAFTDQPCPAGSTKEALSPGATISVVPAPDIPVSAPVERNDDERPSVTDTKAEKPRPAERKCAKDDDRCVDDWPGPNDVPTAYTYGGSDADDGRIIDGDRIRPSVRPRPKVGR